MPRELSPPVFETRTVDELAIDDEASFEHVSLYGELKAVLRRSKYPFRVLASSQEGRWDRTLFLNLTFWSADGGGDLLPDARIPADVVAHVAWHHLAACALPTVAGERPSSDAMLFGEAIASAFDVYLVGRLLGHAPGSSVLETQVPAMADAAAEAGASDDEFEALLTGIARDPDGAFEDLRFLLFHAASQLVRCTGARDALEVFHRWDDHRFAMLLHRFELSNWVLHARAHGAVLGSIDPRVVSLETAMGARGGVEGDGGLGWLTRNWLER